MNYLHSRWSIVGLVILGVCVLVGGGYATHRLLTPTLETPSCTNETYTIVNAQVRWKEEIVPDVDLDTFCAVDEDYARDVNAMYYATERIEGADPHSFRLLGEYYGQDDQMTFWASMVVVGADHDSFEVLTNRFARDATQVYSQGVLIEGADSKTFVVQGGYYATDDRNTYFLNSLLAEEPLSIKSYDFGYAQVGRWIYFQGNPTEVAEPDTFEVLSPSFARDSYWVYFQGNVLDGADPFTFELVSSSNTSPEYGRDKNYFYVGFERLEGINPKTARILGGYIVDEDTVYASTESVPGADPKTLSVLEGSGFATDKSGLWSGPVLLASGASHSFKSLGNGYAADATRVFYVHGVVPLADPATFVSYKGRYYAHDAVHVYYGGEHIGNGAEGFELLSTSYDGYAKTHNEVYYNGALVAGANAETFTALDDYYGKDAHHRYYEGKMTEPDASLIDEY